MKRIWLLIALLFFPAIVLAETPGMAGFKSVRHCIMENDIPYCRASITLDSLDIFNRFVSYKLMPCLPTDFIYVNEEADVRHTTVKIMTPSGSEKYIVRLLFAPTPQGPKLDIPASLRRGLGENWQEQINLSEQLYLMMRQNMGDKLTCDMLNNLVKPR